MKKLIGVCLAALVVYTMYYDLKYGTLPKPTKAAAVQTEPRQGQQSEEIKVKPGQTVLTIVEHLNREQSVPISKIVRDFEQLNPGVNANEIQIGQTYHFPIYGNSE